MNGKKEITELEAQELLAHVLNNTPVPIVIGDETYHITSLKLGTMNLIAEESVKIQKAEEGNMVDVFKQFAQSVPSVIKCLCYAILNDKNKIFKDYSKREHSDEYQALYERIEWESDRATWLDVLAQILQRLDIGFFCKSASMLTTIRDSTLKTKKKMVKRI